MQSPDRAPALAAALRAAALAAVVTGAAAAPELPAAPPMVAASASAAGGGDAVLNLLRERGLLPQAAEPAGGTLQKLEASPIVRQVRDTASDLVLSAMNFLGVRYRRGGNSADEGFDCSGFTRYVFENSIGLVLPRRADQQAQQAGLLNVDRSELRPGDLVFFNTMRRAFSHVGIYIGEGRFIHAPRTGGAVRIEDMRAAYWAKRYDGARRADLGAPAGAGAMTPVALPAGAAAERLHPDPAQRP